MKLLFFDLETTGLDYKKCSIIEFAVIIIDIDIDNNFKPVDIIDLKMKPRSGKFIDQRALEINKYSLNEIMLWQNDNEAYLKFINFLSKHVDKNDPLDKFYLAGYNSTSFDFNFLCQWFKDNGDKKLQLYRSYFWWNQIDVMCEATRYLIQYRPIMNNFKLFNVAKVLDINVEEKSLHNGLYDVKLTYNIFKKIIESNHMIMAFDEQKATKIFNDQTNDATHFVKLQSKFNEDNAWIQVQ